MLILERLKDKSLFTNAEYEVVDYILKNPKKMIELTVDELATTTFSSPSSIVRLCKKVGMKGYSDFKIKLATEINTFVLDAQRVELDMPIMKNAKDEDIPQTFLNLHYQALSDVYNSLDMLAMKKAVQLIKNADLISLFGRGESLIIAEDLHYKLRRIGVTTILESLNGFETALYHENIKKNVAILISHYGNSRQVKATFNDLKFYNIPIILITANKNTILTKLADVVINIDNNETHKKLGSFASRTAMQFVTDCLYGMLFATDYEKNLEQLDNYYARVVFRSTSLDLK